MDARAPIMGIIIKPECCWTHAEVSSVDMAHPTSTVPSYEAEHLGQLIAERKY